MSTKHRARGAIPAAILALVFAGAWIPAVTHAQGEAAGAGTPESDPSSSELREIEVLAPKLMKPFSIASSRAEGGNGLEEVTVRGQRSLTAYRLEVVAARERIWDMFNEMNSSDRFDISCSRRSRTGTRISTRVCRPQYADYATSKAGKEFLRQVQLMCSPPADEECLEAAFAAGSNAAQRYTGEIAHMDQRLDEEAQRLARENPEFASAILDYQAKRREYQDARQRR